MVRADVFLRVLLRFLSARRTILIISQLTVFSYLVPGVRIELTNLPLMKRTL